MKFKSGDWVRRPRYPNEYGIIVYHLDGYHINWQHNKTNMNYINSGWQDSELEYYWNANDVMKDLCSK